MAPPPPDEASGSRARSGSGSNPSQPPSAPVRPRPPTVSMVSRGALGGAIGSAGGPGMTRAQQPRMTFRPVLPQRRKPTEIKQEPTTPASLGEGSSASSPAGRGGARGGRGGGRGRGRGREITMTASGPFAMGTGSLSRSERARRGGGMGGGGGGGFAPGSSSAADIKSDMKPLRSDASYRNPDKLRDAEQYSDQEDDVEIVDMGNVAELDELAPRSLPRMQEKDKKKGKAVVKKEKGKGKEGAGIVKPDPEDEEASDRARLQGSESGSGSASSTPPIIGGVVKKKKAKKEEAGMPGAPSDDEDDDGDAGAEEVVRGADALDLSESEEEEMMDDLADDFVFEDTQSDGGSSSDNNRLYLFQFPQMFPKFKAAKAKPMPAAKPESDAEASSSTVQASSSSGGGGPPASALSSSPPGGSKDKPKRSVAFAEGVKNGTATPPDNRDRKPTPAELAAGSKRLAPDGALPDPLSNSSSQSGPEGMIGRLQIYKDGRVEMHFGSPSNPLVMEVAGGSQSSFLQDVALLDAKEKRATVLGEVHRKFTVSPGVEGMLRDWEGWCAGENGGGGGEESESSSDEEEVGVKREVKREASARV